MTPLDVTMDPLSGCECAHCGAHRALEHARKWLRRLGEAASVGSGVATVFLGFGWATFALIGLAVCAALSHQLLARAQKRNQDDWLVTSFEKLCRGLIFAELSGVPAAEILRPLRTQQQ